MLVISYYLPLPSTRYPDATYDGPTTTRSATIRTMQSL